MLDIKIELTKDADGCDLAVARFDRHPEEGSSPITIVTVEIIQWGYSDSYAMSILSHTREDTRETVPLREDERRAVLYAVAEAIDTQNFELRVWADQFDDDCDCGCGGICEGYEGC